MPNYHDELLEDTRDLPAHTPATKQSAPKSKAGRKTSGVPAGHKHGPNVRCMPAPHGKPAKADSKLSAGIQPNLRGEALMAAKEAFWRTLSTPSPCPDDTPWPSIRLNPKKGLWLSPGDSACLARLLEFTGLTVDGDGALAGFRESSRAIDIGLCRELFSAAGLWKFDVTGTEHETAARRLLKMLRPVVADEHVRNENGQPDHDDGLPKSECHLNENPERAAANEESIYRC